MSRRKRRTAPGVTNFMGNVSAQTPSNGDLTQEEYLKMLNGIKEIGRGKGSAKGRKDVLITFNPLRDLERTPRFTFRIYSPPKGMTIEPGDRAVLYPVFDETRKRIYFMKNDKGNTISRTDSKNTVIIQVTCYGDFKYFIDLYERGTRHVEADWQIDGNVNIPYVDVSHD